jgi:hypothetical protein
MLSFFIDVLLALTVMIRSVRKEDDLAPRKKFLDPPLTALAAVSATISGVTIMWKRNKKMKEVCGFGPIFNFLIFLILGVALLSAHNFTNMLPPPVIHSLIGLISRGYSKILFRLHIPLPPLPNPPLPTLILPHSLYLL